MSDAPGRWPVDAGRIRRLLRLRGRQHVADEVESELAFHMQSRIDDLVAAGLTAGDAETQARREFGDLRAAREELIAMDQRRERRTSIREWLADAIQDARVAIRAYAKRPVFSLTILLTLTVGIGANTAIFAIAEAVWLRPLGYRDADQLVHLFETRASEPGSRREASYPDFVDWRAMVPAFAALEGYNEGNVTVATASAGEMIRSARVSSGFFRMLGVRPAMGRDFTLEEETGAAVAILSHELWTTLFGGDPRVLDSAIVVDGRALRVVGVLPRGFRFAPHGDARIWTPLDADAGTRANRLNHWVNVVGRLRDGATIREAEQQLQAAMARIAEEHPESHAGRAAEIVPLRDQVVGRVRPLMSALIGAVLLVLAIACANVANLFVARAMERGREIAVRVAIGASRARLLRQLVVESLLISLVAAALGMWLASQGIAALLGFLPDTTLEHVPALNDVRIGMPVLLYTTAAAVATAIACGLAPSLHAWRVSPSSLLRGGAAGARRGRMRDALVVFEIALTFVLVAGALLMTKSLVNLMRVDPGFATANVVTARVSLARNVYPEGWRQQRFFETLLERLRRDGGIETLGAITNPPLNGGGTVTFRVEGEPEPPASNRHEAALRGIAGDYFRTLGIPLVAGRVFSAGDDSLSRPVVLINRSLARRLLGERSAIGRQLRFYAFPESAWTIVGVVGDVRAASLDSAVPPTVYYTHLQAAENRMNVMIRTSRDAGPVVAELREAVRELDPRVAVYAAGSMNEHVMRSPAVLARRYPLVLVGAFALSAIVLAVVGVYGVIAFAVAQRTRELAVRSALGATGRDISRLILGRGVKLALVGLAAGIPAALLLTRYLRFALYGVTSVDALSYMLGAAALALLVILACWIPARRASRLDPAGALRSD